MTKKKNTSKPGFNYRRALLVLWAVLLLGIFFISGLFYSISQGNLVDLPPLEELENPKSELASEVYTSDQVLLGKYYSENRSRVQFKNLPKALIEGLIATEDARFHDHSAIDIFGLMRVLVKTVLLGQNAGGGSTITQQLAKNWFNTRKTQNEITGINKIDLVIFKLTEWVIAVQIEKHYTKREIITMYLNRVSFPDNTFGIKSASTTFFGKSPDSLEIHESAVLIASLKGSTLYNPRKNPQKSLDRRNIVLGQMVKYGYLSVDSADSLKELPLVLNYKKQDHNKGLAPHFRQQLRLQLAQWCKENTKVDGSTYDLYRDGLKIYTTLHSKMQEYAEAAVDSHLRHMQGLFYDHWAKKSKSQRSHAPFSFGYGADYPKEIAKLIEQGKRRSERYRKLRVREINGKRSPMPQDSIAMIFNDSVEMTVFSWDGEKDTCMTPLDSIMYYKWFLEAGFSVMEPQTGYIRAWVGSIDHKYFKYDHVNTNSRRQVGSTFKPFVYSVAIEEGWSPCKQYSNTPITFEKGKYDLLKDWTPKNSDAKYGGMMSLIDGLAGSINVITARLMYDIGPKPVVELAHRLGITGDIPAQPSICLGTPDVSVYEMMGAYSVFANQGFYVEPSFITRIEDKNGNIIAEFKKDRKEVISEETAYIMTKLLKNVVNHGTGIRLRYKYKVEAEMGGKTGTTQNQSDGWFMGVMPQMVMGTWVGHQDRSVHFTSIKHGQGASLSLPIAAMFLKQIKADKDLSLLITDQKFEEPSEGVSVELDCSKHDRGTKNLGYGDDENF